MVQMVASLILRPNDSPRPNAVGVRYNVVFLWATWVLVLGASFLYGDGEDQIAKILPGKLDKREGPRLGIVNESWRGV